jgi:hypothetical protein
MAVVAHFLRCLLLFLNVYDTFKTLKYPPPSARNNGRPSVRAMTARKRELKGVLAVWIVWVSGGLPAIRLAGGYSQLHMTIADNIVV